MKLPIIFIGEAPARDAFGPEAFNAPSGVMLAQLCGLSLADLLARCMTINVLGENPGKSLIGDGDAWPSALARAEWPKRLAEISSLVECEVGRGVATWPLSKSALSGAPSTTHQEALRLVFCGRRASAAARLPVAPWAVLSPWGAIAGRWVDVAVIPHPSGLNRAYNDRALREQVSGFLKNLLTIAAGGEKLTEP